MATFSTSASIGVSDAGASTQSTGNVVVASDAIVYALVVNSDATPLAPTGVTWDPSGANQAFTQLGTTLTITSFGRASLWRIITPTAGTAPVRASWSGNQTERTVIVWVGTNIDTATPNETPVTATGTNTTPTATANTGIVSGDMVVTFGAYQHALTTARTFNSPTGGTNVNERQDTASSPDGYSGGAVMDAEATGTSISPQWTMSGAVDGWGIFVVPLNDGVTSTRAQQGSRFGADDGSESAHTWLAAQGADVSVAPDTPFRVRLGVQATGDPAAAAYQLEWRKVGDSNWTKAE
jgi:hypothetical protein